MHKILNKYTIVSKSIKFLRCIQSLFLRVLFLVHITKVRSIQILEQFVHENGRELAMNLNKIKIAIDVPAIGATCPATSGMKVTWRGY